MCVSHPQGTTAALAEREQRLRELETQFHAERGMLQLQASVVFLSCRVLRRLGESLGLLRRGFACREACDRGGDEFSL